MVSTTTDNPPEHDPGDVQTYLISRYREALKSGDKSYAKSCLLSTRLFSVNDPNITHEIYQMAKSDGDVGEAAKCFATLFLDLLQNTCSREAPTETLTVINQMKEEIKLLLNELKTHSLKLKSSSMPSATVSSGQQTRQATSVSQSPMLSPRLRMSSEDRSTTKESVFRLDSHLHSATKGFFYQQLFDDLPKDVKKSLLNHSIGNCDNPLERCRLMMLSIVIFDDSVATLGSRLLRNLMDLSTTCPEKSMEMNDKILGTSRPSAMCQYAKSMLVLDAIPLVLSLPGVGKLDVQLDDMLTRTLNFYSEHCLESASCEYELDELHEGLKKTITARILGKDLNTPDDMISDNLITSMNVLMYKFLDELSGEEELREKHLSDLKSIIEQKDYKTSGDLDRILDLAKQLDLEDDIPESILFQCYDNQSEHSTSSQQSNNSTSSTAPPKGRGRPKKAQTSVIVSPDDGVMKHLKTSSRLTNFMFYSVTQLMFRYSLQYLKQTRSRILMRFDNSIANLVEAELNKNSSSRSSRSSKNSSQEIGSTPAKKIKVEIGAANEKSPNAGSSEPDIKVRPLLGFPRDSPLNTEQSRFLDSEIVILLQEIHKCIQFLSDNTPSMTRVWNRFTESTGSNTTIWYSRVFVDSMIISGDYEQATKKLHHTWTVDDEPQIKKDSIDTETSTLTVGANSFGVGHMRAGTQLISCYVQQQDKENAFQSINNLLVGMISSGVLTNDNNYSMGNIIDEYMILIENKRDPDVHDLGFLFFNTLSMIRYVVDILIDIIRKYVHRLGPTSDTIVGHSIVLSQLDWPKEAPLYEHCIAWLRANKPKSTTPQGLSASTKFTYPQFFQFVTDPNIIEDFVALLNEGYTLDIASRTSSFPDPNAPTANSRASTITSEKSTRASGKTMTTRGVNRNVKDHLKFMLINQMEQSTTLVPLESLAKFIVTKLLPSLMPN